MIYLTRAKRGLPTREARAREARLLFYLAFPGFRSPVNGLLNQLYSRVNIQRIQVNFQDVPAVGGQLSPVGGEIGENNEVACYSSLALRVILGREQLPLL